MRTTLDGSRNFKNFFLSYLVIQKISDRLCVQHGLSIIEPKPYREREIRTDYPKNPSFRDGICEAIDAILQQKPEDFDTFLRMLEEYGYEVKRGKNIALKGKGQQRFIRLQSFGEGYSEEEIRAVIAGAREHQPKCKFTLIICTFMPERITQLSVLNSRSNNKHSNRKSFLWKLYIISLKNHPCR